MDQLPVPIQKIIWIDYVDPDFEDLITKDTSKEDFLKIYDMISDGIYGRDADSVYRLSAKVGNLGLFIYFDPITSTSYNTISDALKLACEYGNLHIIVYVMDYYHVSGSTYEQCIKKSMICGHFIICDFIISKIEFCLDPKTFKSFSMKKCVESALYYCRRSDVKKISQKYGHYLE